MLQLTITFHDGNVIHTGFNGSVQEAIEYYFCKDSSTGDRLQGRPFNLGDGNGGDAYFYVEELEISEQTDTTP